MTDEGGDAGRLHLLLANGRDATRRKPGGDMLPGDTLDSPGTAPAATCR
jgi:hypothetical protein